MRKDYYHATHNNYIIFMGTKTEFKENRKALVDELQTPKLDSCLVLFPGTDTLKYFTLLEKDNTMSAMCGNGVRAAMLFLIDQGLVEKKSILTLAIADGYIDIEHLGDKMFKVNMGPINPINTKNLPMDITAFTSKGEPHVVIGMPEAPSDKKIKEMFSNIQQYFPKSININIVTPPEENKEEVFVYNVTCERGVNDITQSCGTGSTSVAEYIFKKYGIEKLTVKNRGGDLKFQRTEDGNFICTGPADRLTI